MVEKYSDNLDVAVFDCSDEGGFTTMIWVIRMEKGLLKLLPWTKKMENRKTMKDQQGSPRTSISRLDDSFNK